MSEDMKKVCYRPTNIGITVECLSCWDAHGSTAYVLEYFPEFRKLVSGGYDHKVNFWNIREDFRSELEGKIDVKGNPNCLKQWKRDSFLCGTTGSVHEISIFAPYKIIKSYERQFDVLDSSYRLADRKGEEVLDVIRLEKSDEDCEDGRFAALCRSSLTVINYKDGSIVYRLADTSILRVEGYANLLQSQLFPNSVFLNCLSSRRVRAKENNSLNKWGKCTLRLLDIDKGEYIKWYDCSGQQYGMATFMDRQKKNEYLLSGGNGDEVFIFNVSSMKCVKRIKTESHISCFLILGTSHFFAGQATCVAELFDVDQLYKEEHQKHSQTSETDKIETENPDLRVKLMDPKHVNDDDDEWLPNTLSGYIEDMCMIQISEKLDEDGKREVHFCCATADAKICMVKMCGLKFEMEDDLQKRQSQMDLKERIEYLFSDEFCCRQIERNFRIVIQENVLVEHINLRVLLMLS